MHRYKISSMGYQRWTPGAVYNLEGAGITGMIREMTEEMVMVIYT